LALLEELHAWGLPPLPVTSDAGYGEVPTFRLGLETRGLDYMTGVPSTASAQPAHAHPSLPAWSGRGRRPTRRRYPDRPTTVGELVLAAGQQACVDLIWRRGSRGLQRSRFVALPVRPAGLDHHEGRSWQGWHHHVTLVSAAHLFCTLERRRSRPWVPARR